MGEESRSGESPVDGSRSFEYRIDDHETVVEAVVNAIGRVTDTYFSPTPDGVSADGGRELLPPLHDAVDSDALARLSSDLADTDWQVTFPYAGYEVSVVGADRVVVSEPSIAEDVGE